MPFLSLLDLSAQLLQGRELRSSKAVLPLPSKVVTREHTHECVRGVASGSMPLWDPEMWGENSSCGLWQQAQQSAWPGSKGHPAESLRHWPENWVRMKSLNIGYLDHWLWTCHIFQKFAVSGMRTNYWLANKIIKLQKNKSIEMVNRILSIGVARSTLSVLMILLICFFSWTLGYSLLFYFMLHYLIVHIFGLWLLCHFKNHKKMKNLRLGESIDNM